MYAVMGITGQVGGAAARHLLDAGQKVRALVRNREKAAEWAAKGVELMQGDATDSAAVVAFLEGAEGAFLLIPPIMVPSPDFSEAKAVIASFKEGLRQTPVPRLVLLSSFGSEQSSGLGNITSTHLMEEALGELPFSTAFVRAGGFIENYVGALEYVTQTGVFPSLMQPTDKAFPTTATEDTGKEIAHLLANGWSGKKIIEIGSLVSPDELALAMGQALGRTVTAQAVPREQWAAYLEQIGLPHGKTSLYEEMMDGVNSGWIHFGEPGTESVAGTTPAAQVFAQAKGTQGNG